MFNFFFYFRRAVFIYSIFALSDHPTFQIQLLFVMNLLMTIYIGGVRPFKIRAQNSVEILNEYQFSVICYFMVVFTDFIKLVDRYQMGFIQIALIVVFFLVNMTVVLRELVKGGCLIVTRLRRICERGV